jgi:hypothetical protein
MSRVDDASDRRAEEARQADLRAQERVKKERTAEVTAFDRAMSQKATEQAPSKLAFREALAKPAQQQAKETAEQRTKGTAQQQAKGTAQQQQTTHRATEQRTESQAPQPRPGQGSLPPQNAKLAEASKQPKASSSLVSASGNEGRSEDIEKSEKNEAAGVSAKKEQNRVEDVSERNSRGSGQDDSQGEGKEKKLMAFRMPSAALMAPPPLALPKDASAARMSSVTKEIVDKIVSRVLVGTNAQGASEFRIDLKSSVLKGLSIKISGGRGGKISAVFSGTDREVLASLKKSSSELVDALAARGLKLEDLAFEEMPGR